MSMEFMFKTGICFAEVSHQGRIYTLYSDMDEGYQQISWGNSTSGQSMNHW